MKLTVRPTIRSNRASKFAMHRIVAALAVGMLGLGSLTFSVQSHAQTRDVLPNTVEADSDQPQYELPNKS